MVGIAYLVYFIYAMAKYFNKDDEGDVRLLWVTCVVFAFIIGRVVWAFWLKKVEIKGFDTSDALKIRRMYIDVFKFIS